MKWVVEIEADEDCRKELEQRRGYDEPPEDDDVLEEIRDAANRRFGGGVIIRVIEQEDTLCT